MDLLDFTEFLMYNKQEIVNDIKYEINYLVKKRQFFKDEFLVEFNYKLPTNILIILRNYLMDKLSLNYLQAEELLLDCKVTSSFLKEDIYV